MGLGLKNWAGGRPTAARKAKQSLWITKDMVDDETREQGRQERVRAQQGDTGRGRGGRSSVEDDDDDGMSPLEKSIASALGVKEEDFLEERTKLRRR